MKQNVIKDSPKADHIATMQKWLLDYYSFV